MATLSGVRGRDRVVRRCNGQCRGLFGTLASDPQLRAAIEETPECHLPSH
jgi:hypothetical protein